MDKRPAEVTDDDHRQALVALHHRLVPALTDVGFLEQSDDETIALGEHPAFDDPQLEALVSTRHDADDATLDAVFRAVADARRRTIVSILAAAGRPLELEPLARRVAAREAETTGRQVARDRVDDVRTALVHVHVPMLADATIVEYDAETGRVADAGLPVADLEWLRPDDGVAATAADEAVTVERWEDGHGHGNTPPTHELIYRARPRSL